METEGISPVSTRIETLLLAREPHPHTREDAQKPTHASDRAPDVDRQAIESRVASANAELARLQHDLRFSIHEKSGEMVVEIVDLRTGEVLREQPPRAFLDLAVRLHEMVGFFLDART
jgi:flagellar protein FlaG